MVRWSECRDRERSLGTKLGVKSRTSTIRAYAIRAARWASWTTSALSAPKRSRLRSSAGTILLLMYRIRFPFNLSCRQADATSR